MKKIKILTICLCFLLALCACQGNQKPTENEQPASSDTSTEVVEKPANTVETDVPKPDASLKQSDAESLILEKIDENKYKITADGKKSDEQNTYFVFKISDEDTDFSEYLAVNNSSGEIMYYNIEKKEFENYSEFPLYNLAIDSICDWNGEFVCAENGLMLELYQADSNSFEFYITGNTEISGFGKISGNTAHFDGDGKTIDFLYSADGEIVLSGEKSVNGSYKTNQD